MTDTRTKRDQALEWLRDRDHSKRSAIRCIAHCGVDTEKEAEHLEVLLRAILDAPPAQPVTAPAADPIKDQFEARMCKGIPADCCDYAVISLKRGIEVCRVWAEEDVRKIAELLNQAEFDSSPSTDNAALAEAAEGALTAWAQDDGGVAFAMTKLRQVLSALARPEVAATDDTALASRLITQAREEWLASNDQQDGPDATPYDVWFRQRRTVFVENAELKEEVAALKLNLKVALARRNTEVGN